MIKDILIPFITVGLAELGDKTQLAVFCLSSKTKKYIQLLLGVMLAFIIADGLAILFGGVITTIIPVFYIKFICSAVFIIFGILTLLNSKEEDTKCELKSPLLSGFSMILISEMGDKTQIASAMFAAEYNPWLVFVGVIFALFVLSVLAIFVGNMLVQKLNRRIVSYIAGGLFIVIGISCLVSLF